MPNPPYDELQYLSHGGCHVGSMGSGTCGFIQHAIDLAMASWTATGNEHLIGEQFQTFPLMYETTRRGSIDTYAGGET